MGEKEVNEQRKKKRKSNKIDLRIDEDERMMLDNVCFEDGESISQVVRKAIRTYCAIRNN